MERAGDGELIEKLPQALLFDILSMLEIDSLCSLAPVSRTLCSSVSQVLSSLATMDLSRLTSTPQILSRIMSNGFGIRSLTLDCRQLVDSSINIFAKHHLEELFLMKCYHFSSYIFLGIGQNCLNLRVLSLELMHGDDFYYTHNYNNTIGKLFKECLHLESLSLKFHGLHLNGEFDVIQLRFPKTLKTFLLQPISTRQAIGIISNSSYSSIERLPSGNDDGNSFLQPSCLMLQSLALVLTCITDDLMVTITNHLPQLIDLCLEDNPLEKPSAHHDLSNAGLQLLASSKTLTRLSLSRSQPNTFQRVTDLGILVLAEGCRGLESVRLGGFSKVTDAGYVSILQSFRNLKRFEVIHGFLLSDLAFNDLYTVAGTLFEVVLISCHLLTSETAESLTTCANMKVLDLGGCKSMADRGLNSIAMLCKLTSLDLSGADITDSGLRALGLCRSPIVTLRLRGCKRIGDRGFKKLLNADNVITKTLVNLDLGYLIGLSDETIVWIAKSCRQIANLCIRNCFFVTDASVRALCLMEDMGEKSRSIKKLDLYNCIRLSADSVKFFSHPYFRGLRWLGFGNTMLHDKEKGKMEELFGERPWISICAFGCEMDCKDGWFLH